MSKVYNGDEPYLFVSYSHKDKDFVESVVQSLQRKACNIWYDPDIVPGKSWNDDIAKHLKNANCFLLFLSDNSICSEYVLDEIYYAKKLKIDIIPCYIKNIELPDELDLSIGRIQAVKGWSKTVSEIVEEVGKKLPQMVFHKTTSPFYTGRSKSFFLECTSSPLPAGAYFAGEDLESFELYWMNQKEGKRNLIWRYQFMAALDLDGLSISCVHKFEDPYFDEEITDVVLFNLILSVSGRYPTSFPCVDIVITIGIVNAETDEPGLVMINGQAFNNCELESKEDKDFAKRLVETIMCSVVEGRDDSTKI